MKISFSGKEAYQGEVVTPPGAADGATSPGLVVVQEWWGVNDHMRDVAGRFAKAGFLVVLPDLYDGKVTKDAGEAGALMQALDTMRAVDQIRAAALWLKAQASCSGKVGVTGFCMGGAMSFAAACHVPGLSAVVPFYGIPPAEKVDYANVTAPVLAHFARRDEWAAPSKAEAIKAQLDARGAPMELCVYDAEHAFFNDTRPDVHHAESASLAWKRTIAFLHRHLG